VPKNVTICLEDTAWVFHHPELEHIQQPPKLQGWALAIRLTATSRKQFSWTQWGEMETPPSCLAEDTELVLEVALCYLLGKSQS